MRGNRLKSKIRGLLTLGKLQEALQVGVRYIQGDQIIVLSSEFHANRRDYLNGFIVNQRYNVVRNRITLAYLELLKDEELIAPLLEYRRIWKPRRLLYILLLPFLSFERILQIPNYLGVVLVTVGSLIIVNEAVPLPSASGGDNSIQVNLGIPNLRETTPNTANEGSEDAPIIPPTNPGVTDELTPRGIDTVSARRSEEENAREELSDLFGPNQDSPIPSDDPPDGDPNGERLVGISTGSGTIGGGLGNRGVTEMARLSLTTEKVGTVVVSLCVDSGGLVIPSSVKFTQRGSTTSDQQLISAAISNAKKWQFSTATVDRQCGTITYNFKMQ